jgi:hypothetical protein
MTRCPVFVRPNSAEFQALGRHCNSAPSIVGLQRSYVNLWDQSRIACAQASAATIADAVVCAESLAASHVGSARNTNASLQR